MKDYIIFCYTVSIRNYTHDIFIHILYYVELELLLIEHNIIYQSCYIIIYVVLDGIMSYCIKLYCDIS